MCFCWVYMRIVLIRKGLCFYLNYGFLDLFGVYGLFLCLSINFLIVLRGGFVWSFVSFFYVLKCRRGERLNCLFGCVVRFVFRWLCCLLKGRDWRFLFFYFRRLYVWMVVGVFFNNFVEIVLWLSCFWRFEKGVVMLLWIISNFLLIVFLNVIKLIIFGNVFEMLLLVWE